MTIKGTGKYVNGVLTILTKDTLYDICFDSEQIGYRKIGEFLHCGAKLDDRLFNEIKAGCKYEYVFDPDSFEVLERRNIG